MGAQRRLRRRRHVPGDRLRPATLKLAGLKRRHLLLVWMGKNEGRNIIIVREGEANQLGITGGTPYIANTRCLVVVLLGTLLNRARVEASVDRTFTEHHIVHGGGRCVAGHDGDDEVVTH
jgi:hypothetical protein